MNSLNKPEKQAAIPEKLGVLPSIVTPWQWGLGVVLIGVTIYLLLWSVTSSFTQQITLPGVVGNSDAQLFHIDSPVHGMTGRHLVQRGMFIEKAHPVLEVLWTENSDKGPILKSQNILAPAQGKLLDIFVQPGEHIQKGQRLLGLLTPGKGIPEIRIYLPSKNSQQVKKGQQAIVRLLSSTHNRVLRGTVVQTSLLPLGRKEVEGKLINASLAESLLERDTLYYLATIELNEKLSKNSPQGFSWTISSGQEQVLFATGMLVQVSIVIKRQKPLATVFPFLQKFL